MMILPPRLASRPARQRIARQRIARLLLASAAAFLTIPSARHATAADIATTPTATSLSVHDQLKKDRTDAIEPYLYGLAIAGAICAWKFRQKRRHEQVLI